MEISKLIKSFAMEKGIIIGVCDSEPLIFSPKSQVPFVRYKPEQRKDPQGLLKDAKSIIVLGAGYNKKSSFMQDEAIRGHFSLNATGLDYHITLRKLLEELETRLRDEGLVFDCHISVDTGPLPEKLLAVKAGLSWIGKHGLCISEEFGSFFNIGYMLTTMPIKPWLSVNATTDGIPEVGRFCEDCNVCVNACPGGALTQNSHDEIEYDYSRCVSYLTQKKGDLTAAERLSMGRWLYGCDICQKVCPHNQNTYVGNVSSYDHIAPKLQDVLTMSKKEFTDRYKNTAIYWRGLDTIKRNALIAMENHNRDNNREYILPK